MKREIVRWKKADILVIEDDPGDQELTRRALHREDYRAELHLVSDAEQAMDYLLKRGQYSDDANASLPDLILLDLNLPGASGKRILEAAKTHPELRQVPVVVVSSSAREQDIHQCYDLGCNSYVIKPIEAHRFIASLREIYNYWFGTVALPSH